MLLVVEMEAKEQVGLGLRSDDCQANPTHKHTDAKLKIKLAKRSKPQNSMQTLNQVKHRQEVGREGDRERERQREAEVVINI